MIIKFKGKETELRYNFNSFKHMADFDLKMIEEAETKPFKIIPLIEILLLGALNHNPKIKVKEEDVQNFLEEYVADGDIGELLEQLMSLLQESNFFKSLQKKEMK